MLQIPAGLMMSQPEQLGGRGGVGELLSVFPQRSASDGRTRGAALSTKHQFLSLPHFWAGVGTSSRTMEKWDGDVKGKSKRKRRRRRRRRCSDKGEHSACGEVEVKLKKF